MVAVVGKHEVATKRGVRSAIPETETDPLQPMPSLPVGSDAVRMDCNAVPFGITQRIGRCCGAGLSILARKRRTDFLLAHLKQLVAFNLALWTALRPRVSVCYLHVGRMQLELARGIGTMSKNLLNTDAVDGLRALAVMHIVLGHHSIYTGFLGDARENEDSVQERYSRGLDLVAGASMALFYIISGFVILA